MSHFVVPAGEGKSVSLGGLGIDFKVWGDQTGGAVAIVEHPLAPRALAAPLHRHSREDELSIVLEGVVGAQLGDEILTGGPGTYLWKPRDQWHTFWNAGDEPARLIEILSPAGFEKYFEELPNAFAGAFPDQSYLADLAARFGLEIDPSTVPGLLERHNLTMTR
jgi:quercetin dioxygenase-like cupin family protein